MIKIEDIMSHEAQTVRMNMPLIEAVNLLNESENKSLPVINQEDKLVGSLREKDLILNDSFVHLQTLYKLLGSFDVYKKDSAPIADDLKKILNLKVSDVMSPPPPPLKADFSVEQALAIFTQIESSAIPVIDESNKIIGLLTLSDLTKIYGVSLKGLVKRSEVDKNIDSFLQKFEKQFVVVTKTRTRFWFLISMSFGILGFIIATALLIRITVQY